MKKRWMPIVAAVLQFLASIPYLFLSVALFIFPDFLPEALGGTQIWAPVGFVVWFPYAVPLFIGGISALIRKAWGLALIGAVTPMALTVLLRPWQGNSVGMALFFRSPIPWPICQSLEVLVGLFMVAAAVLVVWSRKEFSGRQSFAEHLYSPPKWWRGTGE
jgi:hypothetical protein